VCVLYHTYERKVYLCLDLLEAPAWAQLPALSLQDLSHLLRTPLRNCLLRRTVTVSPSVVPRILTHTQLTATSMLLYSVILFQPTLTHWVLPQAT
jgi:hypothetical protein